MHQGGAEALKPGCVYEGPSDPEMIAHYAGRIFGKSFVDATRSKELSRAATPKGGRRETESEQENREHHRAQRREHLVTPYLDTPDNEDWPLRAGRSFRPGSHVVLQGHPDANLVRKHVKSATLSVGGEVLASQLAYELPAANFVRKQVKSATLRTGVAVLPSQFA